MIVNYGGHRRRRRWLLRRAHTFLRSRATFAASFSPRNNHLICSFGEFPVVRELPRLYAKHLVKDKERGVRVSGRKLGRQREVVQVGARQNQRLGEISVDVEQEVVEFRV